MAETLFGGSRQSKQDIVGSLSHHHTARPVPPRFRGGLSAVIIEPSFQIFIVDRIHLPLPHAFFVAPRLFGPLRLKIRTAHTEHLCYDNQSHEPLSAAYFVGMLNMLAALCSSTLLQQKPSLQQHICHFQGKTRCCRTKILCGSSSSNKPLFVATGSTLMLQFCHRRLF